MFLECTLLHSCTTCSQFHQHFAKQLLRQYPIAKKIQTWAVSTKKLLKRLSYKKAAHKILVKLTTPGWQKKDFIFCFPVPRYYSAIAKLWKSWINAKRGWSNYSRRQGWSLLQSTTGNKENVPRREKGLFCNKLDCLLLWKVFTYITNALA